MLSAVVNVADRRFLDVSPSMPVFGIAEAKKMPRSKEMDVRRPCE